MISYLDNGATTPLCQPAYEAMKQVAENTFGNPSSLHTLGMEAESVVEQARQSVMTAFQKQKLGDARKPEQIVFTSGGTEANNLALLGTALSKSRFAGKTILVGESEHASVSACADHLEALGFRIVRIPSPNGVWDMDAYRAALSKNVILVSAMLVNNETGALHQAEEIVRVAHEVSPDIFVHIDAVQAFCKFVLPRCPGADLVSVSSHKIGGPKGVGA
ncbi:MAG: aminotransferase class V-fold PLP-dependent enzyme [Ruminococcus sp.]|nr:aminotransferase class V-fold PLP-dependent enzyme [Candidatus Apopatosoma intestinale]